MSSEQLFTKPRLRKLLDATENANKEDVRTYCTGHLNPRFLAKLPTEQKVNYWKSAQKRSNDFSTSTTSFPGSSFTFMKTSDFKQKEAITDSKRKDELKRPGTAEKKTNKLKEELKLPEIMLPRNNSFTLPSLQDHSVEASLTKHFEKHKFLTTYLAGVTSKDQYNKMLDFDKKVLQTPGTGGKSGSGCIRHLEEKLITGIINLQKSNPKHKNQRFKKLALHAAVWNDITQDSAIYGELLADIKTQYDLHLTNIIEMTKDNNQSELIRSYQLVNDLSVTGKADDYLEIKDDVEQLALQCQHALLRNSELHSELEDLIQLTSQEKEDRKNAHHRLKLSFSYWRTNAMKKELQKQIHTNKVNSKKNNKNNLRSLRSELIAEFDIFEREKKNIKTNFFPKAELQVMNGAKKDIENDIHKMQQKINVTLVLNVEKKKKVLDLISFARSHGFDFSDLENQVQNMKMDPNGMSLPADTEGGDMREALVKPDLVAELNNKLNTTPLDLQN